MSTVASLVGDHLFRLGSQGPAIEAAQLALKAIGFPLKGTGYFGGATDVALSEFQRRAGLTVDGVLGGKTAAALDIATAAPKAAISIVHPASAIARPLWLAFGLTLINVKEKPGSGDNLDILEWAKEEGGVIAKEYLHDSIPWCALFINHILTKVALRGTETLWALDFASGDKWPSVALAGPTVGAICAMERPGGGHVVTIAGRDQDGNYMCLGGNQGDEVSVRPFPRSRLNRGFRYPAGVSLPAQIGFDSLPIVRSNGQLSSNEA